MNYFPKLRNICQDYCHISTDHIPNSVSSAQADSGQSLTSSARAHKFHHFSPACSQACETNGRTIIRLSRAYHAPGTRQSTSASTATQIIHRPRNAPSHTKHGLLASRYVRAAIFNAPPRPRLPRKTRASFTRRTLPPPPQQPKDLRGPGGTY